MSHAGHTAAARALRFKILSSQAGGVTAALSRADAVAAARANVNALSDDAYRDIQVRIARLADATRLEIASLFAEAHDIRAIAATFGYAAVGALADQTCYYLQRQTTERLHDRTIMDALSHAMSVCLCNPHDPLVEQLVASCRRLTS